MKTAFSGANPAGRLCFHEADHVHGLCHELQTRERRARDTANNARPASESDGASRHGEHLAELDPIEAIERVGVGAEDARHQIGRRRRRGGAPLPRQHGALGVDGEVAAAVTAAKADLDVNRSIGGPARPHDRRRRDRARMAG